MNAIDISSRHFPCRHLVQFYDDEAFLDREVRQFLQAGLSEDAVCVVIATPQRINELERSLPELRQLPAGKYVALDAPAALCAIFADGWPQPQRFASVVGEVVAKAAAMGRVRVFSELVALLCQSGRPDAALGLESLWSDLATRHPFELLCAYHVDAFTQASTHRPLQEICAAHDTLMPASADTGADIQQLLHTITALQQCAVDRETVERRRHRSGRQAEKRLRAANDELESRVQERTVRLQQSNSRLIAEIAERKRAEQALQQSQKRLRELGRHTEQILEEERKRIARELHDQLGQNLMALRIDVLMMQAAGHRTGANIDATVGSALDNIDSMIKNVRAIINNLRPAVLDLGLAATFEWEVKAFERRSGIACTLATDRNEYQVDDARALALLRILQESLTNVLRHSQADRVDVLLQHEEGKLCLRVADNGVGAYPGCRRKAKAFGLIGIQERVSALGGSLSIETGAGEGLALTVRLPLGD